ncbi:hypothetical protein DL770_008060 [Monosporascus sp. CRB-9-2]|nr:hypothetical protein DL770_008060 [Monosporascus sp. CRB-9-2]
MRIQTQRRHHRDSPKKDEDPHHPEPVPVSRPGVRAPRGALLGPLAVPGAGLAELVRRGEDAEGILAAAVDSFDHQGRWYALPAAADYVLNMSPSQLAARIRGVRDSPMTRVGEINNYNNDQSDEQQRQNTSGRSPSRARPSTPCSSYRTRFSASPFTSTIGAGADTPTAGTLTCMYLLSRHAEARQEVSRKFRERRHTLEPAEVGRVSKLPYLDAVLKEPMRVLPVPSSWRLGRMVPQGGATIAGAYGRGLPDRRGTPGQGRLRGRRIQVQAKRWVEAGEERRRRMERAFIFMAFFQLRQACVHIAWLEMKKAVPLILMNFAGLAEGIRIGAVKYPPPLRMRVRRRDLAA